MALTLATPIIELPRHDIAKLVRSQCRESSRPLSRRMSTRPNVDDVTVEDLLNYFPARYEDRSHFISIDQLEDGMEAAVEIYVGTRAACRSAKIATRRKPPLYLFEITGGDADRRIQTGRRSNGSFPGKARQRHRQYGIAKGFREARVLSLMANGNWIDAGKCSS